jgi:hypothetical protein
MRFELIGHGILQITDDQGVPVSNETLIECVAEMKRRMPEPDGAASSPGDNVVSVDFGAARKRATASVT